VKIFGFLFCGILALRSISAFGIDGSWLHRGGTLGVWQSPVDQKLRAEEHLSPAAPLQRSLQLAAAKGEWEAASLIVEVTERTLLLDAAVSDLTTGTGDMVAASSWHINLAEYVRVTMPTEPTYAPGLYPDPLLPIGAKVLVPGKSQLLWLELLVPPSARAGSYKGFVTLKFARRESIQLPIDLTVFNFEMPRQMHQRSSYAVPERSLALYHHLSPGTTDFRMLYRKYLAALAAHHLDASNPAGDADAAKLLLPEVNWPLHRVVFDADENQGRVLKVCDDSPTFSSNTAAEKPITIPTDFKKLTFTWKARAEEVGSFLVSLNQLRADGSWIATKNIDFTRQATPNWQAYEEEIFAESIHPEAVSFVLRAYARAWTPQGQLQGTTYFDDFVLSQDAHEENLILQGDFDSLPSVADVEPRFDFDRFDAAVRYAVNDLKVKNFNVWIPGAPHGGWGEVTWPPLMGLTIDDPQYRGLSKKIIAGFYRHLEEMGWADKAYSYSFDEPDTGALSRVADALRHFKDAAPDLKRLVTNGYTPELDGMVEIWTPLLSKFSSSWAEPRRARGEHLWWYVCTTPNSPYPGYFIDQPGIDQRIQFWMKWKYQIEGSLYWSTTHWNEHNTDLASLQNPWTDPQSYLWNGYRLGNGEGRLFYPPRDFADGKPRLSKPVVSIRLKIIREGIEDYEYFHILRERVALTSSRPELAETRRVAAALLELPSEIVRSTRMHTERPGELQAYRVRVARAIEALAD
jgi:hypothetical protein